MGALASAGPRRAEVDRNVKSRLEAIEAIACAGRRATDGTFSQTNFAETQAPL